MLSAILRFGATRLRRGSFVSSTKAYLSFKGRLWKVPQAFQGERLAIRALTSDGTYGIYFGAHRIASIDLTNQQGVGHVSEQVSGMSPD